MLKETESIKSSSSEIMNHVTVGRKFSVVKVESDIR